MIRVFVFIAVGLAGCKSDVDDFTCCLASTAPATCAVDCSQPTYQNVQLLSSPRENVSADDVEWCCVFVQDDKVVARYDAAD